VGIAIIVAGLAGCSAEVGIEGERIQAESPQPGSDPFAPCTSYDACCTKADLVCVGDPDTGHTTCSCSTLWDCSKNPKKCEQDKPVPSGGGDWTCTWTAQLYTCKSANPTATPGGNGWTCSQSGGSWTCTKSPPNPSNKPGGASVWKCTVEEVADKVICERASTPDASTPKSPDAGAPPPRPKTETNCADGIDNDGDGLVDCKDTDCPACKPPCPAGKECCDGVDNNGDGKIDEGNVCGSLGQGQPCPPGAYQSCDCYCGVHRRCKADGTWGPCKVDGSCQLAQITSQSQCGSNAYCDFGKCVPSLFGMGLGGQCTHHNDCPAGLVCDLGDCIPDHYFPCP
jgi:hypothetical protein